MPHDPAAIHRLIEDGLSKYGTGDLDGALLAWERALSLDPDNTQAASYVEYVRTNYEVLVSGATGEDSAPFGIDDEPSHRISTRPGEVVASDASPMFFDPTDEGWFIESEQVGRAGMKQSRTTSGSVMFEMEADEPPPPPRAPQPSPISFDDAMREYPSGPGRPPAMLTVAAEAPTEFDVGESTGGFGGPQQATPPGFGSQITDVRKRDLGFVQPSGKPAPTAPGGGVQPAALKVTVRTPTLPRMDHGPPQPPHARADGDDERASTDADPPAVEQVLLGTAPTVDFSTRADLETPTGERTPLPVLDSRSETRELPPPSVAPGPRPVVAATATQRLPELQQRANDAALQASDDPAIGAPTRGLAMRPPAQRADTGSEEQKTGEADVRAIRRTIAAESIDPEGTRADFVLPFDPIDARAGQILDEVDADAPASESKEDRLRRRIGGLFDRALGWNGIGEVDKAVAAIDLALSEEPGSPLAQKLIHRNRDTIMTVFQNFLGDLERQPQLARPLHELANAPISPRAAFLLSRVDGTLTIDEILDVSGMPRLEAYRYLSQLFLRGILK